MASPSERMTRRQGAPTTMTHELLLLALGHEGAAWLADQAASVAVARRRGRSAADCRLDLRDLIEQALERTECACTVCGDAATTGHEHTALPLCGDHAAWWTEALTERTGASDWDAEGDLRDDAHDELMQSMRLDHADRPEGVVMASDPLDGVSLAGVGVAP